METLVEDLRTAIPSALEADDHQNRVQEVEKKAKRIHDTEFKKLADEAASRGIQLVRTASGFAVAPMHEGDVLSPDEFENLSQEKRKEIEGAVAEVQDELRDFADKIPQWRRDAREKIKELNRAATRFVITHSLAHFKRLYEDLPDVLAYFKDVERDVVENAQDFCPDEEEPKLPFKLALLEEPSFRRYQVNVLVDNSSTEGAPVIYEDHPVYHNLLGRVEHRAQMGTLLTDFTLIKPGALHRANGGYLVLDALRMLQQPYAWEGLKRALHSHTIRIETMAESLSLASTVSLHPEPIPLDVKVVLLGDRMLYYLLYQSDRDFAELFKVAADFSDRMERSPETCRLYARVIATVARRQENRRLDAPAVARVLEHSARIADDAERLTTHMRTIADLLHEADYWASQDNSEVVRETHIAKAIDKQIYRADRMRERVQEEIHRGSLMIDTQGEKIAQVNGLSVIDLGNFAFGRPSRITATARLGRGNVVDIEREVDLGGSIHSKGVLIITSFLAARYAKDHPLSLHASLVFEQSYGMVDGDSASVAELCALLSALAEVPINQSLAVTGSVNQLGQVQPIGGVNEKIEGYFDVCRARGLTGNQGVLIPEANVKNLMLRRDVVQAAEAGRFHVHAIRTVDEAIALLTGVEAGEKDDQDAYPPETVNHRVAARLHELFELRRRLGGDELRKKPSEPTETGNPDEA
jgi:lon-related putative ATP-dependent protease